MSLPPRSSPASKHPPFVWHLRPAEDEIIERLIGTTGCLPATARLLAARGITSITALRDFLHPSIRNLPHPDVIRDLSTAAERIIQAILCQQPMLVFGDYDADGVTSTALVHGFLSRLSPRVHVHLPHREKEGYGLKPFHIPRFVKLGIRLLITVDCGISSHEAIHEASKNGLDVVITDHHRPGEVLPQACAVVDPQRKDCDSGLGAMAGVGLAFYLIMAVRKGLREKGYWQKFPEPPLLPETDFVALGTVADLVPLTGINRILVHAGINSLRKHPRPGIQALCRIAGLPCENVDSEAIAFRLAPRINAAGRMAHPDLALALLSAASLEEAMPLALELDRLNSARQTEENRILTSIESLLARNPEMSASPALVLHSNDWSPGVIGIVASRLVRRHHKPAVLIAMQGDEGQASARSIPGLDLYAALSACSDLLQQYGGHAMAAGFRIAEAKIPSFQKKFHALMAPYAHIIGCPPPFIADTEVLLSELTPQLLEEIQSLGPFGMGNSPPLLAVRHLDVVTSFPMGSEGVHRRLLLRQTARDHTRTIPAVIFGAGRNACFPQHMDVCLFRLKKEWGKEEGIQMHIEAWY